MTFIKAKNVVSKDVSRRVMYRSSDLTQELGITPNGTVYINYLAPNPAIKPNPIDKDANDWQVAVKVD